MYGHVLMSCFHIFENIFLLATQFNNSKRGISLERVLCPLKKKLMHLPRFLLFASLGSNGPLIQPSLSYRVLTTQSESVSRDDLGLIRDYLTMDFLPSHNLKLLVEEACYAYYLSAIPRFFFQNVQ